MSRVCRKIWHYLTWRKRLMGLVETISADIQDLKDTVIVGLDTIATTIAALREQIASGSGVTVEQLQAIDDQVKLTKQALVDKEIAVSAPPTEPTPA